MRIKESIKETKIYLIILSALGFCYISSLQNLCLRFRDAWIMVLSYEFLFLFVYLNLVKKYKGKVRERKKEN